jgi:hypothetical protein
LIELTYDERCRLQTYFTPKGLIDYFVIEDPSSPRITAAGAAGAVLVLSTPGSSLSILSPSSQEEGKLFEDLKADIIQTCVL